MMKRIALMVSVLLVVGACTSSDPEVPAPTTQPVASSTTTLAPPVTAPPPVETTLSPAQSDGVTANDETIYVGILADLTGPFSGTVVDVVDAQLAFWNDLNESGGIGGRQVEVLIANTGYDLATH